MRTTRRCVALVAVGAALALSACNCGNNGTPDGGDGGGAGGGGLGGGLGGGTGGGLGGGLGGGTGGGGTAGGDGGQPLTPAQFCADLATARCAREAGCQFLDAAQAATCQGWLEAECLAQVSRADAGLGAFDELAARACLASVPTLRCIEGPLPVPAPCEYHAVFTPTGAPGVNCVDSADCVSGYCFGGLRQCRACRPFVAAGLACTAVDLQCDPAAAFCGAPGDGGVDVCRARLADGTPCGANSECGTGWCNWNGSVPDAGPDVCGRVALALPCGDPDDCAGGGWCRGFFFDGLAVTPGVCSARVALGQPCANDPFDDGCVAPASCLGGRCAAVPAYGLDAGAECEGLSQCDESLFCRGFDDPQPDGGPSLRSGVCTARLGADAGCSFATYVDTDCAAGLTCGPDDTCVARKSRGVACAQSWECRDFLTCPLVPGTCEPFRVPGEACGTRARCTAGTADGRCEQDGGVSICGPKLATGAACVATTPADCASGRCFAGDAGAVATCQVACVP